MTTSLALPKTATLTSARKFMADIKADSDMKRSDSYTIHIRDIEFRPEWNIRQINLEHVEALKATIANGELFDALEVEGVYNEDNKACFHIVDGHHTYSAIKSLFDEAKHDGFVPVVIFKGNEQDKLIRAFNSTQGLKLTPLEQARVYERMLNEGMTKKEVSQRTGKSLSVISNALYILNADEEVITAIEEGKIKSSRVGRIMREHGTDNASLIVKAEIQAAQGNSPVVEPESPQGAQEPTGANNQESDTQKGMIKASKQALQYKTLSKGKTQDLIELVRMLANREAIESDGNIKLSSVERIALESAMKEIKKIDSHNQAVSETMSNITG
ncbi:ParB/RepB/Spo0J family partition protein [Vibrio agarivorans]|uniref:ParB/RepB/Spo0J family partition protein n=1 Tax=Vibrio agarivorans TaxID=153622 RepID=UPI0025B55FF3|nr:hypothetical protein [Vibrio agarivorans]MDN3661109.1 hypothetical protein [Vibrio agarivorans]